MSEPNDNLNKDWIGKVIIGTFVIAILIGWDFKFLPYWYNLFPIVSWFLSLILNSLIRIRMNRGALYNVLRPPVLFASTVLTIFMLVDRFGDFTDPEVVPAQVTRLYQGNFLALSSWGVDANYPDGTKVDVGGGHFQFDFTPTPGMKGKAVIGRGLFGIRYIERLEFGQTSPLKSRPYDNHVTPLQR